MKRQLNILMAEDSPSDAELAREAFRNDDLDIALTIVGDGVEAMEYMNACGGDSSRPFPDLILLDLNMPRKDGKTVLRELKSNDTFKLVPVVILTTSQSEEDITQSYELAASCYISKPMEFDKFVDTAKAIKDFYFSVAQLPPRAR